MPLDALLPGGWVRAGRPSSATLRRLLEHATGAPLSYEHVGSTLEPEAWPDRTSFEQSLRLGSGDDVWRAAADALRSWACHGGIGARVVPATAPLEVGTSLLVVLPAGPACIVVPDRVVWVVDDADRFGFGYGTVDGHQERGEEAFLAERSADGVVTGTIRVDARTATVAATALAVPVRAFQRLAVARYLGAWHSDVERRVAHRGRMPA